MPSSIIISAEKYIFKLDERKKGKAVNPNVYLLSPVTAQ